MALIHHAKVTHYFSPSPKHLGTFFRSLTTLYAEQRHTDLLLVTAAAASTTTTTTTNEANAADSQPARDSVVFGTHQMILASCSTFVKDLIEATTDGCQCETLTIFLPDFQAETVKNFLSILYTGSSIGNCDLKELKCLLETLKIDTRNLSVKSQRDESNEDFPDVELPNNPFRQDESTKSRHQPNLADFNFSQPEESKDSNVQSNEGNNSESNQDEASKEMLEITPEVQFFGNHFLAGDEEDDGDSMTASEPKAKIPKMNGNETSSMIEQTMARHKEMTMAQYRQHNVLNGAPAGDTAMSTNGIGKSPSSAASLLGLNLMMSQDGGAEDNKNYNCRLCGKMSGNGASLFAHLLYPHYAHLWREEVPHRAHRYNCKECNYSTVKRQHFVMHVARVHDELRKKLAALGENLEVLDNLTQKSQNSSNERIVSTIAKGVNVSDDNTNDDSSMHSVKGLENSFGGLDSSINGSSPNFGNDQVLSEKLLNFDQGSRFPRGFKPFVKCRLCGKSWKGKDNFFTHLVSTHFKYLWAKEVPRQADMFRCHVPGCRYQSKYRYNFLFHLAGKHKQLKLKLAQEGIPLNVLNPIESDSGDFNDPGIGAAGGGAIEEAANALMSGIMNPSDLLRQSKMLLQNNQQRHMRTPPSALKNSEPRPSGGSNNTRLICRVCNKVSLNHTCHRQHVVGKHFYEFWAHLTADGMGIFNCHHIECTYKTPNRSVFIIHLAYVHQELKNKLLASGKDPNCVVPDVYGKRKYRRAYYDNTQHRASIDGPGSSPSGSIGDETPMKSYRGPRNRSSTTSSTGGPLSPPATKTINGGSGGVPVQCTVCKNEYQSQRKAIEHLAISHFHHVWSESSGGPFAVSSSGPFSCQHCSFTHGSRQTFICHLVSQHNALKHVLANQFNGEKSIEDLIVSSGSSHLDEEEDDIEDVLGEEEEDIEDEDEEGIEEVDEEGIDDLDELEDEDDLEADEVGMSSQGNSSTNNQMASSW